MDWLHNSDESPNLVTFLRADDKDEFLVAINFSNHPLNGSGGFEKNVDGFVPFGNFRRAKFSRWLAADDLNSTDMNGVFTIALLFQDSVPQGVVVSGN